MANFAGMTGAYLRVVNSGRLGSCLQTISDGCKCLSWTNALAYLPREAMTKKKNEYKLQMTVL